LTIASDLERARLEHRLQRLDRVLSALQNRVLRFGAQQAVPVALRDAIADFQAQRRAIQQRLSALPPRH